MPISRDEWTRGRTADTTEARIEGFLRTNRGNAFTRGEIAGRVFGMRTVQTLKGLAGNLLTIWDVDSALKVLVREGRIQAKEIRERLGAETYYSVP